MFKKPARWAIAEHGNQQKAGARVGEGVRGFAPKTESSRTMRNSKREGADPYEPSPLH